jgi:ApbE superfamily uncharacterized protein (UPF0280 family)
MNKYSEKYYRTEIKSDRWNSFRVINETTDLYIRSGKDLTTIAGKIIEKLRNEIRDHINKQLEFQTSYSPIERLPDSSEIVQLMYLASERTGTGPFAAVAGAIAQMTGLELLNYTDEIIIENGGDIWMSLIKPAVVQILSGNEEFDGKTGVIIYPENTPCGICTSSGKIGPSFSFGKADSATIIGKCAATADAAATLAGNIIKDENDIAKALNSASDIETVTGAIIIVNNKMGIQGSVKLVNPMEEIENGI